MEEIEFAREQGVLLITLQQMEDKGLEWVCGCIVQRLQPADSVYISLDIDVVDPAFCPAQKYPRRGRNVSPRGFAHNARGLSGPAHCGF